MISRFKDALPRYRGQFWVLFFGQLVSSTGTSLVWPFMTIYVHEKLDVPLTVVGSILAANSIAGLLSRLAAGPLIDRMGRKAAMLLSLGPEVAIMASLGLANSLPSFVVLMILSGFFLSIYRPALNAMVADIIDPDKRIEAYGLMRIVANLGIAIGPAIGGFVATRSYLLSFLAAAATVGVYFLITVFFVKETKPTADTGEGRFEQADGGYGVLFRDYPFLIFCITLALMGIAYAQMMTIFPVYIKEQHQITEQLFGLIMATNAAMVVLFQFPVARILGRYRLGPVLASGAGFVALGVGSVALFDSFPMFLLSMVIVTIGELIFAPSSTAFVASVAPETMRGRYMGVYGIAFGLAFGLGPVLGGLINDNLGPVYIWHVMAGVALASALAFLLAARKAEPTPASVEATIPADCGPPDGQDT